MKKVPTIPIPSTYLSDERIPGRTRILLALHLVDATDRVALANLTGLDRSAVRTAISRLRKPEARAKNRSPHLGARDRLILPKVIPSQQWAVNDAVGDGNPKHYPPLYTHRPSLDALFSGRFADLRGVQTDEARKFWRFFRWNRMRIKIPELQKLTRQVADQIALHALAAKVAKNPKILDEIQTPGPGLGLVLRRLGAEDLKPFLAGVPKVTAAIKGWDADPEAQTIRELISSTDGEISRAGQ